MRNDGQEARGDFTPEPPKSPFLKETFNPAVNETLKKG